MDLSDFKNEDDKLSFRVIQIKEIYENLKDNDNSPKYQSQLYIEGVINMLISSSVHGAETDGEFALKEVEEQKMAISVVLSNLKDIAKYYSNKKFDHDFDIVFQNQIFFQILIHFISECDEEEIRCYSFIIIFLLICAKEDILNKFIEYGLYKSFVSILSSNKLFDSLGYFFISNILYAIFSFYSKSQAIELFLKSPLSNLLVELLSDSSNRKLTDNDFNQFNPFKQNPKFQSETSFFKKKEKPDKKRSFEELILSIIQSLYKFCGNPDDDLTDKILTSMLDLMTNQSKAELTSSVSRCLSTMIVSSKYALIQSVKFGLIQNLNIKFNSIEYELAWPYILKVDIVSLRLLIAQINDPTFSNELDLNNNLAVRIFKSANPFQLYNLINYSIETYEEDEKEDEQRFVSRVLNCFSAFFNFNSKIIIEEYNEKTERTQTLTLEQLHQILNLLDDDVCFSLKKNGVLFILSAINYQDCLHSRVDIIDQIFAEQNQLILSVLENCHYPLKKLALSVFINLTDKISTLTNRYDNISSLFNSQEFNELLENWKNDENEEIQGQSNQLIQQIAQVFPLQ